MQKMPSKKKTPNTPSEEFKLDDVLNDIQKLRHHLTACLDEIDILENKYRSLGKSKDKQSDVKVLEHSNDTPQNNVVVLKKVKHKEKDYYVEDVENGDVMDDSKKIVGKYINGKIQLNSGEKPKRSIKI